MRDSIRLIYRTLSPKFQKLFLEYKVKFQPRYGHGKNPHQRLYSIVDKNRSNYIALLKEFIGYAERGLKNINMKPVKSDDPQPAWINGFFPGLDTIALYGFISRLKPSQIIEVGSGNSTKVARKAISDNGLKTRIISIDPYPRAEIDRLADSVIRQPVEDIDLSLFSSLKEGDILFIDNSHRSFPNSDVTVCFLDIIPELRPGVVVHIHDIYLPYDYPQFMADRFYSEQYLLATLLLSNPDRYEILCPNYFLSEDKEMKAIIDPFFSDLKDVERHGGSFWFKVKH